MIRLYMKNNYLSQETEIKLINRFAPFLSAKSFLDVGAEKGAFSLIMLELGLTGVMFEPMPRHLPNLQKITDSHKGASLYNYAITNIDKVQSFNVAVDANGRELDFFHSLQKADAPGIFTHNSSFEVECRSLENLVALGKVPSEIGILKIDTEGNDLNVLRGLGSLRPQLVICEYFAEGLYNGWPEGSPDLIIKYMSDLGYSMFISTKHIGDLEFIGLGTTLYQEKQWGNLFFFREDFYDNAKFAITESLMLNEKNLIEKFNKLNIELEEKEKVIQQLFLKTQGARTKILGKMKDGKRVFLSLFCKVNDEH